MKHVPASENPAKPPQFGLVRYPPWDEQVVPENQLLRKMGTGCWSGLVVRDFLRIWRDWRETGRRPRPGCPTATATPQTMKLGEGRKRRPPLRS